MQPVTNLRAIDDENTIAVRAACTAPRPKSLAETGLSLTFLAELLEKHLYEAGVLTLGSMIKCTAVAGPILEEVLNFLRREGRIEVRARMIDEHGLRYALTERGRASARVALERSGYVGAATVPLEVYSEVVRMQSVRDRLVTRDRMHAAFADTVLDPAI